MPSVSDNLNTTIAGYATALAADSVSPQPSYTLDGKSVSRNEWRESLERLMEALQKQVNALSPYCVVSRKTL
jgi:hypothetical protein